MLCRLTLSRLTLSRISRLRSKTSPRQVPTHAYAAPAADEFASQLDALFADTRAPDSAARKAQDAAPAETFAGVESLFAEPKLSAATDTAVDADFPATFRQSGRCSCRNSRSHRPQLRASAPARRCRHGATNRGQSIDSAGLVARTVER
jgi:hypothetical protein